MKSLKSYEIRDLWLRFFAEKGHFVMESQSLIPVNDPSLLWINSGVATLKPYFDGRLTPPSKRLTSSQKSIRTNDIENVGFTARHHTLFEMLGNFSVGDYFKKEAILYAWEFLTNPNWLNIDVKKLYVTIYEEDLEAYNIWHSVIGLDDTRIIKGTRDTNFWDIGEGPCGPNTEIFYDRGIKYDPQNIGLKLLKEDIENDRYLEIWNIVFSQFNHKPDGTYEDLPRKNIDTGAGLERITSIMQDAPTNFETDLFMPLIRNIESLIKNKFVYDQMVFFTNDIIQSPINSAFKIIADHIRAITFAIADGVFPSNKERGYVIRRLIRRAMLYGHKLGINKPFLFELVDTVITTMGSFYKYLNLKRDIIVKTIKNEEERFLKTLSQGYKLFYEYANNHKVMDKEICFKLFESYGFPIEMILEESRNLGVQVDENGLRELLDKHKELSRSSRKSINAMNIQNGFFTQLNVKTEFIGYKSEQCNTSVEFIFDKDNNILNEVNNSECYLILAQTPFYAEKGGQDSDTGIITTANGDTCEVIDVQQGPNGEHIHYVKVVGSIKVHDKVLAEINHQKRFYTMKNHSGTHFLHAALREILGDSAMQIGSFNNESYLRLDITYSSQITESQVLRAESLICDKINEKIPCEIIFSSYTVAVEKYKALAFFTEKYLDTVRIVKFGDFSCELCGGTHCHNSSEIEDLLIYHIESKGSNTFRVLALTSYNSIQNYLQKEIKKIKEEIELIINYYKQHKDIIINKKMELLIDDYKSIFVSKEGWRKSKFLLSSIKNEFKIYQQNVIKKQDQLLLSQLPKLDPILSNKNEFFLEIFNNLDIKFLKKIVDNYRSSHKFANFILLSKAEDKYKILISINSKNLKINAKNIIDFILNLKSKIIFNGGGSSYYLQGELKELDLNINELKDLLINNLINFC